MRSNEGAFLTLRTDTYLCRTIVTWYIYLVKGSQQGARMVILRERLLAVQLPSAVQLLISRYNIKAFSKQEGKESTEIINGEYHGE